MGGYMPASRLFVRTFVCLIYVSCSAICSADRDNQTDSQGSFESMPFNQQLILRCLGQPVHKMKLRKNRILGRGSITSVRQQQPHVSMVSD